MLRCSDPTSDYLKYSKDVSSLSSYVTQLQNDYWDLSGSDLDTGALSSLRRRVAAAYNIKNCLEARFPAFRIAVHNDPYSSSEYASYAANERFVSAMRSLLTGIGMCLGELGAASGY